MHYALNTLGYKSYHVSPNTQLSRPSISSNPSPCKQSVVWFSNPQDSDLWILAQDAKFSNRGPPLTRQDFDQLLGGYSAVSADPPACFFAEELVRAYPEAKVILVERDVEAWARSFDRNLVPPLFSWVNRCLAKLDPAWLGRLYEGHQRWRWGAFDGRTPETMRAGMRDVYRRHYELVRRVTPEERLLEYRLEDGWGSLCSFLGKDVPDEPFPTVNDKEALDELMVAVTRRALANVVRSMAPWAVGALLAAWVVRAWMVR